MQRDDDDGFHIPGRPSDALGSRLDQLRERHARSDREREPIPDPMVVSRREFATGLLTAAGLAALSSCVTDAEPGPGDEVVASALTGTTFNWVDTMANLRGIPHLTSSPIVVLEGWTIANDGGGGIFCWDAGSREVDNNGTIIRPGNVNPTGPGRWKRLYSGPLNARWFGAGLGAADDRAAIQAAIDLASQNGGTVFFPAGTYKVSAPLVLNAKVRIQGEGKLSTVFLKAGIDSTIFIIQAAHFAQLMDLGRQMQGGTPSAGSAIVFAAGSTGVTIQRIHIARMWQGIIVEGVNEPDPVRETVLRDITMTLMLHTGMKLCFALNWTISSTLVVMIFADGWHGPGSNHYGVWLDTNTEGCIFDTIFVLAGEHCWRMANTMNPQLRGPSENRFQSCIGDNGTVSCMYISSLHRGLFTNCWCSTQKEISDATVVFDSLDVTLMPWPRALTICDEIHSTPAERRTSRSSETSSSATWTSSEPPTATSSPSRSRPATTIDTSSRTTCRMLARPRATSAAARSRAYRIPEPRSRRS